MKQTIFTLFLALSASVGTLLAWDYERVQIGDLYYNLDATLQTAEVTSENSTYPYWSTAITTADIPSSVTYDFVTYNVTAIGDNAFYGCSGLTSITIPNSVTTIGASAFRYCSALTSVAIGNNVTSIGEQAFFDCSVLTSIEIPNSVTSIGEMAFSRCSGLTSVSIANSVKSIGRNVFTFCNSLIYIDVATDNPNYCSIDGVLFNKEKTEILKYPQEKVGTSYSIPNSVTSIGERVFEDCSGLTSIEIPNSIISFGERAFAYCSGLTSIEIPNSVISIGDGAFQSCGGLTAIEIPKSVIHIGNGAFNGCSNLTSVIWNAKNCEDFTSSTKPFGSAVSSFTFGEEVEHIPAYLCYEMSKLTEFEIPNSVTSIGGYAFENCSNLISIFWNAKNCEDFVRSPFGTSVTSFTFGDEVKHIPAYLCNKLNQLTSIEIPNSVISFGKRAFAYCSGLTSIEIPNSVTHIGNGAFNGCSNLTSVIWNAKNCEDFTSSTKPFGSAVSSFTFGEEVEHIPAYLCYEMSKLTEFEIPNSVTSIGVKAFYGCNSLTSPVYNAHVFAYMPSSFSGGYSVPDGIESIVGWAFYQCTGLTSIEIPNSVTSIGERAFFRCSALNSVTIGNNVTSIGEQAFFDCSVLTSIEIPNSVTSIGEMAFSRCSGLTSVTIGNSLTSIEEGVFNSCSGLTSIEIPNSVISIGERAFYQCSGLTSVTIPNSVAIIGSIAFYECTSLTSIEIPNSVTSIGGYAFSFCYSLTSINVATDNPNYCSIDGVLFNKDKTVIVQYPQEKEGTSYSIPNSVTSVDDWAFENCYKLTFIEIPNSVKSIGEYAFYRCSHLTSVSIGKSVTSIGGGAFAYCSDLISVINNATMPQAINSNVFDEVNIFTRVLHVPAESIEAYQTADVWKDFGAIQTIGNDTSCIIASGTCGAEGDGSNLTWQLTCDNVLTITGSGAMADYDFSQSIPTWYKAIKSATIGDSVTSIGERAFYGCSGLTSVIIGNSVTSIGDDAFQYCSGLTTVIIGNSVSSIGVNAFSDCTSLTSVAIPNSVSSIGRYAFFGCFGLTSINVAESNLNYSSIEGVLFNKEKTTIITYPIAKTAASYVIPNSVTRIENYAFRDCSSLTSVTIGNSIISIGVGAFYGCTGLSTMSIGNSVTSIGASAFYNCKGLTSIDIPNSVTSIGDGAFEDCTGFTSLTIPNSITRIGERVFYQCSNLVSVVIPNSVTSIGSMAFFRCSGLTSVTIGNNVTSIGDGAFYNCTSLASVAIPNSVTSIGYATFYNCTSLTSIEIPNSLTSIGSWAFSGCSGLTFVTIPNSVSSIGEGALYGCIGLASVTCEAVTPPDMGQNVFMSVDKSIPLYVPAESVNLYKSADQWKDFTNILPIEDSSEEPCIIASGTCGAEGDGSNLTWQLSCDSVLTISGTGAMNNNYNGSYPFEYNDYKSLIKYVVMQEGVTTIGDYAFVKSRNLISILLPASLQEIHSEAFGDCDKLSSILIPRGVDSINSSAFARCRGLETIRVEGENPKYDSRDNCNAIINTSENTLVLGCRTTIIPNSVVRIGRSAFMGSRISSINIPESVQAIESFAFANCFELPSISIPSTVLSIESQILPYTISFIEVQEGNPNYDSRDNCNAIIETATNTLLQGCKNTTIPMSVEHIHKEAFSYVYRYGTKPLLIIPEGVNSIGAYAFTQGKGIEQLSLPSSILSIGMCAFIQCDNLNEISCKAIVPPALEVDVFSYVDKSIPLYVPAQSIALYQAAEGWRDFTNILPIEETPEEPCIIASGYCGAEGDGSNLTWQLTCDSVLMISGTGTMSPYSLDKVAPWAPYKNLFYKVVIGEGVTNLSYMSFRAMPNITDFVLASTVKETNTEVFTGTTNINNPIYNDSIFAYLPKDYSGEYVLPEGIRSIEPAAFAYCRNLTSIVMPNSLKYIRRSPFSYSGITNISLPEGLLLIDMYAFEDCSELEEVTIPSTVNKIDYSIFANCNSLMRVSVSDANPIYDSRDNCNAVIHTATNKIIAGCQTTIIPESVVEIGDGAFQHCNNLVNIVLPDNLELIGNNAFWYCTGLKSITIPNPVTRIGTYAFIGCSSLMSVTIHGNNVKIFRNAFSDCVGLMSITCYATNPPALVNPPIFSGVDKSACTLYVPAESIDLYRAADGWSEFANILPIEEEPEEPCLIASGYCGAEGDGSNLTWQLTCDSVLTISGSGTMTDWTNDTDVPWHSSAAMVKEVIISDNLNHMGINAFRNCSHLTSLSGPAIMLSAQAFSGNPIKSVVGTTGELEESHCALLKSWRRTLTHLDLNLAENMSLPEEALNGLYNLQSLALPNDLTSISYMAVAGCVNLQSVSIPVFVTEIDQRAFEDCRSLTDLTFAEGSMLTRIGNWAFYNCHNLSELIIPDGVAEIGNAAFYGCAYAQTAHIPASVQSIGDNAFALCSRLSSMNVDAILPPTVEDKTFYEVSTESPVYVPKESVTTYKSHPVWGRLNIVGQQNAQTSIDNTNADSTPHKIVLNGQIFILRGDKTYTITGQEIIVH